MANPRPEPPACLSATCRRGRNVQRPAANLLLDANAGVCHLHQNGVVRVVVPNLGVATFVPVVDAVDDQVGQHLDELGGVPLDHDFRSVHAFFDAQFDVVALGFGLQISPSSPEQCPGGQKAPIQCRGCQPSILVMTSRSSSNPDMRSTFLAAFSRNFRLISGSSMPPSSKVRMKP